MPLSENHRHGGGMGDGNKIKPESVEGLAGYIEDNATPASFLSYIYQGSDPSGTGDEAITGVGFQPEAVIALATTDKGNSWGMGENGSTYDWCTYNSYDSWSSATATNLINAQSSSGTYAATISSYDSDGITLNWNGVGTGGVDYILLFLK